MDKNLLPSYVLSKQSNFDNIFKLLNLGGNIAQLVTNFQIRAVQAFNFSFVPLSLSLCSVGKGLGPADDAAHKSPHASFTEECTNEHGHRVQLGRTP